MLNHLLPIEWLNSVKLCSSPVNLLVTHCSVGLLEFSIQLDNLSLLLVAAEPARFWPLAWADQGRGVIDYRPPITILPYRVYFINSMYHPELFEEQRHVCLCVENKQNCTKLLFQSQTTYICL